MNRFLASIFLLFISPVLFAATLTTSGAGSPDTDGAYTINWTLASNEHGPLTLKENGTAVYTGSGLTKSFSGKSDGTYSYELYGYRSIYTRGEGWDDIYIRFGTVAVTVALPNTTPTISNIGNKTISEDGNTGNIAFTIGDAETSTSSLTLSKSSSNTTLVPTGNIVFGGSGANRTVKVTPVANKSGNATITVTVSDGILTKSDSFVVTVNAVNDAPTISNIGNQTISEDGATSVIPFTVGDVDNAAIVLTLSQGSSNTTLIPINGIVFGGSGANRTVQVTPAPNQSGSATVTVTVSDDLLTNSDSFVVTVTAVNDAPIITQGSSTSITATEDTAKSFTLNATDFDGDTLTWSIQTQPTKGSAVASGTGTSKAITYTPNSNVNGSDSFVVKVSDGTTTDSITVNMTITAVNDAPIITQGSTTSYTATEDTAKSFTLNATDTEGDTLTWSIQSQGTKGSAVASGTGTLKSITYTPNSNANGSDSFVVKVSDGTTTDSITVNMTITAVNDAPIITQGSSTSITATEDTAKSFTLNATDADDDILTWSIQTQGTKGSAVASGTGTSKTITYTPNSNANGSDSFVVKVSDGTATDSITVNMTITAVNDLPTITSISDKAISEDGNTGNIAFTIGDVETSASSLTLSALSSTSLFPASNIVFGGSGAARTIKVTPLTNASGSGTITIWVGDGVHLVSEIFTITVNAVNDAPVITEGSTTSITTTEDIAKSLTLNATDIDSSTLTWSIQTQGSKGSAVASGTGLSKSITYTPNSNANGSDSFVVKVSDGDKTDTITVSVTITAVNDSPVITQGNSTSVTVSEDIVKSFTLNATDIDGDTLTWSIQTQGTKGSAVASGTGTSKSITYTPNSNVNGSDSFIVMVTDGVKTDSITVNITINAINDAPIANAGADLNTLESSANRVLSGSGTDIDGSIVSYSWVQISGTAVTAWTNQTSATTTFNTPIVSANETLVFELTVTDDQGGTGTDTVNVYVNDRADVTVDTPTANYKYASDEPLYGHGVNVRDSGDTVVKVKTRLYNSDTSTWLGSWQDANFNSSTNQVDFTYSDAEKAALEPGVKYRFYFNPIDDGVAGGAGWYRFNYFYINAKPVISGTPDYSLEIGESYSFTPSVSDGDDSAFTYSIQNKPSWASFSSVTGTLSGSPQATDSGTTDNIVISVSDGTETSSLAAFSISVGDAFATPVPVMVPDAIPDSSIAPTPSDIVGALQGEAGVSGGAASYNIPIALPPGRAGMQPNISLSYSSRAGNGIAGVGWNLSAGEAISRCGATAAQDGFTAAVQYDASRDRLCLNGQRMIVVSGVYGASGAKYRTELDSFALITQSGSINGTATSFTVEYKNGQINTFGTEVNSRQSASGRDETLSWLIADSRDRAGNTITYDYHDFDDGEYLLDVINYTGYQGSDGDRQVRFHYETRPDGNTAYLAGGKTRSTQRLSKITTEYQSTIVREYDLYYVDDETGLSTSKASGRSLLRSVQECANGICLPATKFKWQEGPEQWEESAQPQQFVTEPLTFTDGGVDKVIHENKRWLQDVLPHGDVDGDGVKDWSGDADEQGYYVNAEGEIIGRHDNPIANCYAPRLSFTLICLDADINADGMSDSIRRNPTTQKFEVRLAGQTNWINTGIDWRERSPTGLTSLDDRPLGFADFNGDGWVDIAFKMNSQLNIYFHTKDVSAPYRAANYQNIFNFTYKSDGVTPELEADLMGDMDGNGIPDFVVQSVSGKIPHPRPQEIILLHSQPDGGMTKSSRDIVLNNMSLTMAGEMFMDINGDGLVDILSLDDIDQTLMYRLNDGADFIPGWIDLNLLFPTNEGFIQLASGETETYYFPSMSKVLQMDYDGDGRQEILVAGQVLASSCQLITGNGVKCDEALYGLTETNPASSSYTSINSAILDNSVRKYWAIRFDEDPNGNITVSTRNTEIVASASQTAVIDATGDGLPDVVTVLGCRLGACTFNTETTGYTGTVQDPTYVAGAWINRNLGASDGSSRYEAPDMLKSVENGLGVHSEWVHRPLSSDSYNAANSEYYKADHSLTQFDYDYFHFASSMYAVAEFKQSNGVGGLNETRYRYEGAMYNNKGRGFQGFRQMVVENVTAGTLSMTEFHQKFPLAGKVESARTCLIADNDESCSLNPLSKTEVSYENLTTANANVYWIIPTNTKEESYDLANRNTRLSQKITTINSVDTEKDYGNILKSVTTLDNGFSTVSSTTINHYTNDESAWWFKLDDSTVTAETISGSALHDVTLDPKKEIKTSYTYYNSSRLPDIVTVEPILGGGNTSVVDTDYNIYGLPTTITTSSGGESRSVTTTYSNDGNFASDDGYFVYTVTNDLGQSATTKVYPEHGQIKELIDANGLSSTTLYDAFGRIEQSTPPTGTGQSAYSRFTICDGGCDDVTSIAPVELPSSQVPDVAALIAYKVTTSSVGAPENTLYKDKFNRVLVAKTQGFDGSPIFVRTEYDHLGRKVFESVPSFVVDENKGIHYESFDELNRVTRKRTDEAYGGSFTVDYTYIAHKTDIDALGSTGRALGTMSRIYTSNGQLLKTTDSLGGVTEYAYDAMGNPIVLQDANSNAITAEYNALGQKKYVIDPNMGRKDFTYTAFGEVDTEKDAKNVITDYDYDILGRQTRRVAGGILEATFSYDAVCKGAMDSETREDLSGSENFSKHYYYDGYCRPASVTTTIDSVSYTQSSQYDSFYGRVKGVTTVSGLTLENRYNTYGYLTHSQNAASGYVYQEVTDMDARLQLTAAKKANGLLNEIMEYSFETGQMLSVHTDTTAGGNQRHRIDYDYDDFGNLSMQRVENMRGGNVVISTETYEYDELHRLLVSSQDIAGALTSITYDYDAVGNFLEKSDYVSAGGYTYGNSTKSAGGNAGPNAVRSIIKATGGTANYSYDNNGNMTSGDGRTLTYNAFNKPLTIVKNGITSNFSYGSDQMRYKQVKTGLPDGTETTIYVDKAYEEITQNGVTKKRSYLGDAIITETVGGSEAGYKIGFVHRDRLNSVVTITDENGNVVDNKSYDPFGKARKGTFERIDPANPATLENVAWLDGYIAAPDDRQLVTRRGFTDHEHLDDAELIHMNGRVYDYNIGRFLSVDPFIQSPGNSQSMNPYSYIMNNPLAGTDPSGYAEEVKHKKIMETPTGSHIKKQAGEKVTKTVTNDETGKVEKVTSVTKMADGSFKGTSEHYNGKDSFKFDVAGNIDTTQINSPDSVAKSPNQDTTSPTPVNNDGCQTSINCEGKGNGYDKDDPYYHQYMMKNGVCSTNVSSCTVDNVQQSLEKNAAPGADGKTPITNETVTEIRMAGVSGGHVNHIVDRENHRIINITQSDHIFYNGIVIRSVVEKDGTIFIVTYGEGINRTNWSFMPNRVSWAANYVLATPGFNIQDKNIHNDILSQSNDGRAVLRQEYMREIMSRPKL